MDSAIEKGKKPDRKKLSTILGVSIAITATLVSLDGLGANGFPQFFGPVSYTHLMLNAFILGVLGLPGAVLLVLLHM